MAAMFYSLQEAAERLGKTEADIREIVQSGQLREFRDGPNLLFKVDEVEALVPQASAAVPPPPVQPAAPPIPGAEIPLELDIPAAPTPPQPPAPQTEIPMEPEVPQVFEPVEPQMEVPLEEVPLDFDIPQDQAPQPEMPEMEIPQAPPAEFEAPMELEPPQMEMPELEISEPAAGELEMPGEPEAIEMDISDLEIDEQAGAEPEIPAQAQPAEMDISELQIDEEPVAELEIPSQDEAPEMDLSELQIDEEPAAELEIPAESGAPDMDLSDLDIAALDEEIAHGPPAGTSEILLAQTGAPDAPSELTNADTAITGEGVNVLGETDQDYAITDDTLGETVGSIGLASTGTTPDASLEEIEGDVNLDSFGSGSGLLDLSLQADDTSLGGILDEIYTAEDEVVEPADAGTVAEVAAEADQMAADEQLLAPQPLAMPGMAQAQFEPAPDKASNILGAMLFVPLLFFVYIAVVAVGGLKGVAPSLLEVTQGFIWYIVGGFCAVTAGIGLYAILMADKDAAPAARKPKKAKKPKAKKEKKPKKPKKAKK